MRKYTLADIYGHDLEEFDFSTASSQAIVNTVLSSIAEAMEIPEEMVKASLLDVFQNVINSYPDDNKQNVIAFDPDKNAIMFMTKFKTIGIITLMKEDIDTFFEGKPYVLAEYTAEQRILLSDNIQFTEGDITQIKTFLDSRSTNSIQRDIWLCGDGTEEYHRDDFQELSSEEVISWILKTITELTATSQESVRKALSETFQNKKICYLDDNEKNVVLFRPDEMKIYFKSKFNIKGMITLTKEDVDTFFEGKPYILSSFTEEEQQIINVINNKMSDLFNNNDILPEQIKTVKLKNARTEDIDFNDYPGISPIEVYAMLLKCDTVNLLKSIENAIEDDENHASLIGVEEGEVILDKSYICVFNISGEIGGKIPAKILFELDENGEEQCPCPECWKERHLNITTDNEPETKPTIH